MKTTLLILNLLVSNFIFSQNVGIGTAAPMHKLDVNGDINLTGALKTNGNTGNAGQVLMSNGGASVSWTDIGSDFKNFVAFSGGLAGYAWYVPGNVTKVKIELWGSGGGGAPGGGGGSGGYTMVIVDVTPGSTLFLTVPYGGAGSSSTASPGGISEVDYGIFYFRAGGGFGATTSAPGNGSSAYGSNLGFPLILVGQNGHRNEERYEQRSGTSFLKTILYGNGGNSFNCPDSYGEGGFRQVEEGTAVLIKNINGSFGIYAGAGGGGGLPGGPGAQGLVIIHY